MFRPALLLRATCIFVLTPYLIYGMTEEQKNKIHEQFHNLGMECIKDHVISKDDIDNLKSRKLATGDNVPCFLACIMKKVGLMDDKGMLYNEKAIEEAKKIFDNEEELQKIEKYLHSCSHINSESVTDAENGCERAMMAYKCMMEKASQFGLEM